MNEDELTFRLTNGGLYSQTANFLSHVSTGVDARTGQFTLAAKLPGLQANQLAGPIVSPALHFSPLASHTDAGFGLGWQLGVSTLDLNADRLNLLSGEQFRLDRHRSDFSNNGLLAFHDQKLRSFVVRQMGVDGRIFRVEHKSGDTEWLEVQERSGLAMVVQTRSPQGRQAFFKWIARGNNQFGLESIWDERGPTLPLLRVTMNRDSAVFTSYPGSDSETSITLQLINGKLTHLILPDGDSRWTFEYLTDAQSGLLFPNKVLGPLGSEDTVQYATGTEGHRLPPGAPLASLPRVSSHRHVPGAGQPQIHRFYTWVGTSNFLGGDVAPPGGWQDGTDNLYRMSNYSYTGIERVLDAQGQTLAIAERTWNRFHLQTKEVMTRHSSRLENGVSVAEQKTITKQTIYGDDPTKGWEDQPAWCQLPVTQITRFEDGVQSPREVRDETDYDDFGNVLQIRHADGRVETSVYFPLGGGDGCPNDGSPFVRWLKSQTLIPVSVPGGARASETRYRYALLPRRKTDDVQTLVTIHETAVALGSPELPIGTTTQSWDTDIASAFFGHPLQSVSTLNGFANTSDYLRELTPDGVSETLMQTAHDGLTVSTHTLRHALTGLTLSEGNENAVTTLYAYDNLGRVIRRTASAGTPFAITTAASVTLAGSDHKRTVVVEESDIAGQKVRRFLDGSGRMVREERMDADITGQAYREVWSGVYDHDGNLSTETEQDWLPGHSSPLRLTTTRETDGWGQTSVEQLPDGTRQHSHFDPITLISRQWQTSRTGERSAETEMLRNRANQIEKVTLRAPRSADGKPGAILREERWTFDGFYRPVTHTVVADNLTTVTRTERDVLGRTTALTREDNSVVRWSYATHSDGDLPVKITLTPDAGAERVLAEQTFDGLGRPVERRAGGQTETLDYLKDLLPPTSATQADGRKIRLTYEQALNNALLSATPENESGTSYTYRSADGFLTDIRGGLGVLKNEYSAAGRLVKEHWTVGNETHSNTSIQSLLGRSVSFIDVGGTAHRVDYDIFGRPDIQHAGAITVKTAYDDFGRPLQITTTDTVRGSSLEQSLTYDAFGRELTRSWENTGSGPRQKTVQTLSFNGRDKVTSRRWELAGNLHSDERYVYDARGRLQQTTASGPKAPLDTRTGKRVSQQTFTFNALDGYQTLDTTYADSTRNIMTFSYDSDAPDRPVAITHRGVLDTDIELIWDTAGRLLEERRNGVLHRRLEWGSNSKLRQITEQGISSQYRYDPLGRLGEQQTAAGIVRRFYADDDVLNERSADGSMLTLVRSTDAVFAESRLNESIRTVLLTGTDGQGSVRLESDSENRVLSYTAHGADNDAATGRVGYAGELRDSITALYHFGSYRPYDPQLMLFLAPDSESPLGEGGLNRYAYCGGDPVNRVDPDGHSFWQWFGAGVGIVLGVVAVVATLGVFAPMMASAVAGIAGAASAATTAAVTAAVVTGVAAMAKTLTVAVAAAAASVALSSIAMGTGLASPILAATGNQKAAETLGWISLGTGIASSVVRLVPAAAQAGSKLGKFVGSWRFKLQHANGGRTLKNGVEVIAEFPDGTGPVAMFTDNFQGRGNLMYFTHGNPDGELMVSNVTRAPAAFVAEYDIAARLAPYPLDQPLFLISCYAGRSGAAQAVADVLNRPVIAPFGMVSYNPRLSGLTHSPGIRNRIVERWPGVSGRAASWILNQLGFGIFSGRTARMTTYYPRNTPS